LKWVSHFDASYDLQDYGGSILTHLHMGISIGQVKIILGLMVSQSFCPDIRSPSGTRDQFFFFFYGYLSQHLPFFIMGRPL
jgi:dolichyl-phosphate-mannose--protein O-mannosyl transferase